VRVVDPETNAAYLIVPEAMFEYAASDSNADEARSPAGSTSEADYLPFEPFPAVGTPEWGRMNQRRAELIQKKVRGELTEAERQQYEWLQRKSLEALDAAHPRTGRG
jgi:hypothetical protein